MLLDDVKWVVELSDGSQKVQDDSGGTPSWLDMQSYLIDNAVNIVGMKCEFYDHVEEVAPPNKRAYFFSRAAGASPGEETINFYLFGYVEDNQLHVSSWVIPHIIKISEEVRKLDNKDVRIVYNPKPGG